MPEVLLMQQLCPKLLLHQLHQPTASYLRRGFNGVPLNPRRLQEKDTFHPCVVVAATSQGTAATTTSTTTSVEIPSLVSRFHHIGLCDR